MKKEFRHQGHEGRKGRFIKVFAPFFVIFVPLVSKFYFGSTAVIRRRFGAFAAYAQAVTAAFQQNARIALSRAKSSARPSGAAFVKSGGLLATARAYTGETIANTSPASLGNLDWPPIRQSKHSPGIGRTRRGGSTWPQRPEPAMGSGWGDWAVATLTVITAITATTANMALDIGRPSL